MNSGWNLAGPPPPGMGWKAGPAYLTEGGAWSATFSAS